MASAMASTRRAMDGTSVGIAARQCGLGKSAMRHTALPFSGGLPSTATRT